MGTIAEKLSYLTDTKDLFKDRLNSLGAEITSVTTFRNYLNWLDTFYSNVSNKTDLSENGIVGRTSQKDAILPNGYIQVDYIESSGTQYIDTGVNADINLDINISLANTSGITFGAIYDNNGSYTRYHTSINNTRYSFFVLQNGTLSTIEVDTDIKHNFYIKANDRSVIVDNVEYTLPTTSLTDTELNLWLFARNSNSSRLMTKSSFKLYDCKMYYNNVLVRDFIPCYRNSDNEVGLYDLVNDVFYTNQGTGNFIYGSVVNIPNPDYPQPINNLSGDVAYNVSGKNKLQIRDTYTSKGITSTYDKNTGYITSKGTTSASYPWINIIQVNISAGTTITLSSDLSSYIAYVRCYYDDNSYEQVYTTNDNTRTRTLEHDINKLVILVNFPTNTEINETYYLQLEKGNEVTSFEPYIEPQTFNIPLGNIELGEIETYEDKIYSSNSRFYLHKEIAKINSYNGETISTDYKSTTGGLDIGATVYYGITTTTTEITTSNYPELYAALKEIQDYLTSYKINKEFILEYSSPEIEY